MESRPINLTTIHAMRFPHPALATAKLLSATRARQIKLIRDSFHSEKCRRFKSRIQTKSYKRVVTGKTSQLILQGSASPIATTIMVSIMKETLKWTLIMGYHSRRWQRSRCLKCDKGSEKLNKLVSSTVNQQRLFEKRSNKA